MTTETDEMAETGEKTTRKQSKFEAAIGGSHEGAARRAAAMDGAEEEGAQEWAPRVIFTTDAKPDINKLQISQLRLAQGMTAEVTERKAQIGQFVLSNFPAYDEVVIVPLLAQDIRVFKPDPKAPPHCQAPTGTWGVGNPGGDCSQCPLSKWGRRDPATGRSAPPRCKEGVFLRAYSATHRCLVDFQFLGRAVVKGAFIQQQAMAFGFGSFALRLTSQAVKNDKGQWFEPNLEILSEIPEDHADAVGKWFEIARLAAEKTNEEVRAELAATVDGEAS